MSLAVVTVVPRMLIEERISGYGLGKGVWEYDIRELDFTRHKRQELIREIIEPQMPI
jgi:hypothetical protein